MLDDSFARNFVRNPSSLKHHPALVLNADFRPLSYFPLSLWPWQEAVKAAFLDRVAIIAEYETQVHSPSISMNIPSVVVLRDYVHVSHYAPFTRFNLFLRDSFSCQYCGCQGEMTFDHVVPRAHGGRTTWENVVAACGPCNRRKGSLTLKQANMGLRKPPLRPTGEELRNLGRSFPPNHLHESWIDYLYWDEVLEP